MMNWTLLTNSLLASTGACLLAILLGLAAAIVACGLGSRWRKTLFGCAVVVLVLPPFLVTNSWLEFLGPAGTWTGWFPFRIATVAGAAWILGLLMWPLAFLLVVSAWQGLDPRQLESDLMVSGPPFLQIILWPAARSAFLLASVLTLALALNNFAVPAILQVKVFPAEIWVRLNTLFDAPGAWRLSWPLMIVPLLLVLCFSRARLIWPRNAAQVSPALFRRQLGNGWYSVCGGVTLVACFLSAGLPLFQLMRQRRVWAQLPGALAAGKLATWNSFSLSALVATLIVALCVAVVWRCFAMADAGPLLRGGYVVVGQVAWLFFLLPGVLLGIPLIALFNRPGFSWLNAGPAIVVVALMIRYGALAWTAVFQAIRLTDPALTDSARVEGASRWQLFRHVQWPQMSSAIAAIWYIIYLLCLWDIESIILILPPGHETLAVRIFNLLHYGHNPQVNALCLVLLAVALVPLFGWKASELIRRTARGASWFRAKRDTASLCLLVAAFPVLFVASCAPKPGVGEVSLPSKIFDRVQIVGSRGVGVGQLNKPRSVAVDLADNFFVVDMTGRVQKFSPAGVFLLSWQMPQTDLGKPKGMCGDREGNIVVIEPHYQRLNHFTPSGQLLSQWGRRGTNAGLFSMPRAAAINSQHQVFVSEYGVVERVQQFSLAARGKTAQAQPEFVRSFGQMGSAPGDFNRPEGLCVDSHDLLYVADSCNHRIQIFSSEGKFLRQHGKAGTGLGELSYPYDICVGPDGMQYVCEFGNSRIQVFDSADHPLEIIGGPGAEPGKFSNPWGVALDAAGNLYVADSQNHRVQKLVRRKSAVAGRA